MSSIIDSLYNSFGAPGGKTIFPGNYNVRKTGSIASGLVKNVKPDPMGTTILPGEAKPAGQLGSSNIDKGLFGGRRRRRHAKRTHKVKHRKTKRKSHKRRN
jgi:hypothetical protein